MPRPLSKKPAKMPDKACSEPKEKKAPEQTKSRTDDKNSRQNVFHRAGARAFFAVAFLLRRWDSPRPSSPSLSLPPLPPFLPAKLYL